MVVVIGTIARYRFRPKEYVRYTSDTGPTTIFVAIFFLFREILFIQEAASLSLSLSLSLFFFFFLWFGVLEYSTHGSVSAIQFL
ncbi:hypothetical protein F4860DRAFT_492514 [Xylaria cubensis]|nr:hypothetical protein F4860DRAFT_492514 [Xylaria cubensis]